MSTRSRIGIAGDDGAIRSIYCHFDGYPESVGAILAKSYTDRSKVEALIGLGDISSLDDEVAPPEGVPHSYGAAAQGVTVAYGRDRGESGVAAQDSDDEDAFLALSKKTGGEYTYLFKNGAWLVSAYRDEFKSLSEVLSAQAEEAA
jgi:hypothetical protein